VRGVIWGGRSLRTEREEQMRQARWEFESTLGFECPPRPMGAKEDSQ